MTVRSEIASARARWRLLTFYEKFEQIVVLVLTTFMAIVIAAAVWNLALKTVSAFFIHERAFYPTEQSAFQALFGMIFVVIIALEFKRSLLVIAERRESVVQVRTVVLLAMLAILRKMMILDLDTTEAAKVFGLSAAILALGTVYWLVREQERRLD